MIVELVNGDIIEIKCKCDNQDFQSCIPSAWLKDVRSDVCSKCGYFGWIDRETWVKLEAKIAAYFRSQQEQENCP